MYDFDKLVVRRGTNCVKWDSATETDVIPLWVADMDFEAAPCIREALVRRVEHGVFGYTVVGESYYRAVIGWYQRRHGWSLEREWILYTTGVVPAVSAVIKALTMPGERVVVMTPVYNCFFSCIRNNGCEVLESALKPTTDPEPTFVVDWDDFEAKCADEKTTVFLLCNPHNPVGRVWTREELQRMADICRRHGVRIVSDEIHCELTMPGQKFTTIGVTDAAEMPIVCSSPSKSFNTAGLQMANIICQDAETRRRIDRAININEVCDVNPFGPVAVEAAYNEGEPWLEELNEYVWGNYQTMCRQLKERLPKWRACRLEGTYLAWIDITATGLSSDTLAAEVLKRAHVWVTSGTVYGSAGEGFIRVNLATQRSRLLEAIERIAAAGLTRNPIRAKVSS